MSFCRCIVAYNLGKFTTIYGLEPSDPSFIFCIKMTLSLQVISNILPGRIEWICAQYLSLNGTSIIKETIDFVEILPDVIFNYA